MQLKQWPFAPTAHVSRHVRHVLALQSVQALPNLSLQLKHCRGEVGQEEQLTPPAVRDGTGQCGIRGGEEGEVGPAAAAEVQQQQ